MKKILFLLILSLSVVACGDKSEEPETPPPTEQPQDDTTDGGEDDSDDETDPGTGQDGEEGGEEEEAPEPENTAPVSSAGSPQTVRYGTLVTLDGSASHDPDGDAITYTWALTAPEGSEAELEGADTVSPTFTADIAGDYTAELMVSDGQTDSEAAVTTITALEPQRVAFIGGSITRDFANGWADLTGKWLDGYFAGGAEVKNIAVGGTNSEYGMYRLQRDLDGFVPDIAFIEYVINDPENRAYVQRNVDAIMYKFRTINPDILLAYVATTGVRYEEQARAGVEPDGVQIAREIAELNNVLFVDAGNALWQEIISTDTDPAQYLPDGVHPSSAGHKIYADTVSAALEKYLPTAEPYGLADSHLRGSGYGEAWLAPVTAITDTDCTAANDTLTCETGQGFSLAFFGVAIGVELLLAPDGGQMDCLIDGTTARKINFWDQWSSDRTRTGAATIVDNLTLNWHTLDCRVNDTLPTSGANTSNGHVTRITGVMLSHLQ